MGASYSLQFDTWSTPMRYGELRYRDVKHNPAKVLTPYIGYLYSPKIDGWNCIWDGHGQLWTRNGNRIHAPRAFLRHFPKGNSLAGELVVKGQNATAVASLKASESAPAWNQARFYVFDAPNHPGMFRERYAHYRKLVRGTPLRVVEQKTLDTVDGFMKDFDAIVHCTGEYEAHPCLGEGVVATNPESRYVHGRVGKDVRWKLKRRRDDEARVVGYTRKNTLRVSWRGKRFTLALGMTDHQRDDPESYFPVGSAVKFSYRKLSARGIPLEARVLGKRHESTMVQ